jgi:hypothetical protein
MLSSLIKMFVVSETKKQLLSQETQTKEFENENEVKKSLEVEKTLDGAAFFFKELDRKFVIYDKNSLGIFKAES